MACWTCICLQWVCFFEQQVGPCQFFWGFVLFKPAQRSSHPSTTCASRSAGCLLALCAPIFPPELWIVWKAGCCGGQHGGEAVSQVCCLQHAGGVVGRIDILAHLPPLLVCVLFFSSILGTVARGRKKASVCC